MRLHLVPNSHIDPVWLWDKYEGIDEVLNTFRSACKRMKEFPKLTFSASSLQFYEWVMKYDPALFKQIRKYIDAGRWEVCGGWWVEPDTNLPLESSFLKHAEISAKFAKQHLGVKIVTSYVPDSFGHPATLPKILAQTGFKYFIFCRPGLEEKPDLPRNLFRWKYGNHSVLAYRLKHHYGQWGWRKESDILSMLADQEYQDNAVNCYLFGVGDHGGGPAVAEIQFYEKYIKGKSEKDIGYSTCQKFFKEAEKMSNIPEYSGDLHMHAIGCYSVMGNIKNAMRTSEHALEYATRALKMMNEKDDSLEDAWNTTLFNQFHDILPGSCSLEAAENAVGELGGVINSCKDTAYTALKSLSLKKSPKIKEGEFRIFNTLPYAVTAPITIESMVYFREKAAFKDSKQNLIPIQQVLQGVRGFNSKWEFVDTLPAKGYKAYHFDNDQLVKRPHRDTIHFQSVNDETVTKFLKSLKSSMKFLVLEDDSDTWGHGRSKYDSVIGEFQPESSSIMKGKITTKLCQKFSWGKSRLEVIFATFANLPGVYADIKVNWAEHRKILKMEINPDQPKSGNMVMQCAGGATARKVDGKEMPLHHWIWLPTKNQGMAVLQKGAFAGDCLDGRLRLTLVRSSLYGFHDPTKLNSVDPQFDTDQGMHFFKILLLPKQPLDEDLLNSQSAILNEPFTVIRES